MTVFRLIRKLQEFERTYGPRTEVVVNKSVFKNDDLTHESFSVIDFEIVPWKKNDSTELADGSERIKRVISLGGSY